MQHLIGAMNHRREYREGIGDCSHPGAIWKRESNRYSLRGGLCSVIADELNQMKEAMSSR